MADFPTFVKDPDAKKRYRWNWAKWLDGDVIVSHTIKPQAGITVSDDSHTDTAVTVMVSGGTAYRTYEITCHIVTVGGEEEDNTIVIDCKPT
jgi:hypothetical protein